MITTNATPINLGRDTHIDDMSMREKAAYAFACARRAYLICHSRSNKVDCLTLALKGIRKNLKSNPNAPFNTDSQPLIELAKVIQVERISAVANRYNTLEMYDGQDPYFASANAVRLAALAAARYPGAAVEAAKSAARAVLGHTKSESDARSEVIFQRTLRVWIGSSLDLPRTEQAVGLARQIIENGNWSLAGLLVDALLDAEVDPEHWLIVALQHEQIESLPILGCNWLETLAA